MKGWEVEWCTDCHLDAAGEIVPDRAKYEYRDFTSKAAAIRHARAVLPESFFGSVLVRRFEDRQVIYGDGGPAITEREYENDTMEIS